MNAEEMRIFEISRFPAGGGTAVSGGGACARVAHEIALRLRQADCGGGANMLSHKTFMKKTRRGKVIKVVREHYLRDDIGCGVRGCQDCYDKEDETGD